MVRVAVTDVGVDFGVKTEDYVDVVFVAGVAGGVHRSGGHFPAMDQTCWTPQTSGKKCSWEPISKQCGHATIYRRVVCVVCFASS